jgi:putative transposase
MIRDERDYEQHVNYVHWPLMRSLRSRHLYIPAHRNPVKHGYVEKAVDWKHSSIHRYIKDEIIDTNWGVAETFTGDDYGGRT